MTDATLVADLLDSGAVRFGTFTLTSGQTSDVYVDVKRATTDPDRLGRIADRLAARAGDAERFAGMELGAVPLVVALALVARRPYAIVRKAARTHGTGNRVEGEIPSGARVLVVEDVTTTGGSVVETVGLLRAAGAQVDRVVCVVDRDQGATERLAAIGVRLEPLVTLAELRGSRR
ncbi:MAG: orotate phosphoribosyltransferase [Thermoplasmata archaeon]|jgi:orotate phosphoribosyltransferase|nr:orotate phosphoribosyltransferase [Thermoplasmata archaeon]